MIDGKSVFPIVSPERTINYKWFNGGDSVDNHVLPMTKASLMQLIEDNSINVPNIQCVNEGTILMRHPYLPNTLVSANMSLAEFLSEKLGYYAIILNLLGAKNQVLEARVISKQTRNISSKGKIVFKGNKVEGKLNFLQKTLSRVRSKKVIEGTGKLDHERALQEAKRYGLDKDNFIQSLLSLRDSNPVTHYYEEIEIAKEYNETMDITASLSAAAGAFKINGNFIKNIQTREQIYIVQDIKF